MILQNLNLAGANLSVIIIKIEGLYKNFHACGFAIKSRLGKRGPPIFRLMFRYTQSNVNDFYLKYIFFNKIFVEHFGSQ